MYQSNQIVRTDISIMADHTAVLGNRPKNECWISSQGHRQTCAFLWYGICACSKSDILDFDHWLK